MMHEMSLMLQIFDIINDTAAQHGANEVTRVTLKVGKLANVVPDALEFAFAALAAGTKCEGAELVIEEIPVTGQCLQCHHQFTGEGFPLVCPQCDTNRVRIARGTEFTLDSLDVE